MKTCDNYRDKMVESIQSVLKGFNYMSYFS